MGEARDQARAHRSGRSAAERAARTHAWDAQTKDLAAASCFDRFRAHYNDERPHEALDQETPGSCYAPSPRLFPDRIEEPWYDADHAVRRGRSNGEIRWGGDFVFISEVLVNEPVGIAETERGDWIVRFAD